MRKRLTLVIALVFLCISSCVVSTLTQSDKSGTETVSYELSYRDFPLNESVCTFDDNWCGWADYWPKAVIYGWMKTNVRIPEGADKLKVTVHVCSNGWGEGLAVDYGLWTNNSGIQIIVDDAVWYNKINESTIKSEHHHSYYKHDYGESFSTDFFNVSGKDNITLTIRMMDGARLDFCNVTLTFFTHTPTEKYNSVCYSPFRDNEDPEFGILPTIHELKEDLFLIKNLSKSIRTYGISKNLSEIPRLCEDIGIDCYPGAWISRCKCDNEREIDNLIKVANENLSHVKGLIVGNEVLLRGDMSEDDLIEYIRRVKSNTTLPVGTAEIWRTWLEHEKLAENVDFILVHIHPYWEGVSVENAAEYVVEKWKEVKAKYPGKDVIIGETGWPTQGDRIGRAIPSEENQRMFLSEFLNLAKENEISYFYFDVFDERWKRKHAEAEAHWGLYYSNGTLKPLLYDLVPEDAREGIDRPPRTITVTNVTAPLIVYTEGCSPENRFYPSGRMGDIESWQGDPTEVLDELCTESPHSGNTCIRIKWSPGAEGWAGIYWQYPVNNRGDYPGYNISGAKRLEFWARGEKGCEKAEFKVGGIKRPGKPYYDSLDVSTGVIHLTKEWKKYIINLEGANLSMVIGGFRWLTNKNQNPEGCTIYLDDISFTGLSLIFDTGSPANPYLSISGTHNGTITPDKTINVSRLYTYPCEGTGGHAEYVRIWNSTFGMEAYWNGYQNDWHNITFPRSFILFADETYNFTIKTGSYPQIIHANEFNATGGKITCTEFVDVNGNIYNNWIPAIKLY